MKKVLYYIRTFAHRRVYESYEERSDMKQVVLAPKPRVIDGFVEGYDKFKIKDIRIFANEAEAQKIINAFQPDVLVQADFPNRVVAPKGCKRVFAAHGMIGNHVTNIFASGSMKVWKNFDLYCGETKEFQDWITHITGSQQNVLTNALGQLDLLVDTSDYDFNKGRMLTKAKLKSPSATILFCGFCCKKRSDFNQHNQDYFETIMELEKVASKNNWLVLLKPRQAYKKTMKFLKATRGWATTYTKEYPKVINKKNIFLLGHETNPYKYFFADVIVCNGCSTIEMEACVAKKPLVVVRTRTSAEYDPFGTVKCGAAIEVKDLGKLQGVLKDIINNGNQRIKEQSMLLNQRGILADGLAHKRIQDKISTL